jgi:hypothetical protein
VQRLDSVPGVITFPYIREPEQVKRLLRRRPLVFTGHIHEPGYWDWFRDEPTWNPVTEPSELIFAPEHRYLVQIGSLGEPERPEHPRYLVWTDQGIEWRGLSQEAMTISCQV